MVQFEFKTAPLPNRHFAVAGQLVLVAIALAQGTPGVIEALRIAIHHNISRAKGAVDLFGRFSGRRFSALYHSDHVSLGITEEGEAWAVGDLRRLHDGRTSEILSFSLWAAC